MTIYQNLVTKKSKGQKSIAVLIDPDKMKTKHLEHIVNISIESKVDYFFLGGSLIVNDMLDNVLEKIKKESNIPLVLFPGNSFQISYKADALLFLSLISGRNAELLIGKHVITAPYLKVSPLEIISTGYMLVDGGVNSTVQYMSNTLPIPNEKDDIAMCTAMAGEMLGLKMMYLDAGSGAKTPISETMIEAVSSTISVPLIVGGGIKTPIKAHKNVEAGADLIVIGNAFEKDPLLVKDIADAVHSSSAKSLRI